MVNNRLEQWVGVPPTVRYGLVLILTVIACFSGWWAHHALEPLWGYQDNDTSVYLVLGLPAIAVAVASIVGIICLLRPTPSPSTQQPRRKQGSG